MYKFRIPIAVLSHAFALSPHHGFSLLTAIRKPAIGGGNGGHLLSSAVCLFHSPHLIFYFNTKPDIFDFQAFFATLEKMSK